ncbi:MAG: hypothetical protein K2Y51_05320 [Gammaproteobacteria bacterium]|nr:hypothetical protein [Gammaproteobacteria bacterium]
MPRLEATGGGLADLIPSSPPPTARRVGLLVAAGLASGLICWLGGMLAPEYSTLIRVFPGLVFGALLAAVGPRAGLAGPDAALLPGLVVTLAAVGAWLVAMDWELHGRPWPMLLAGALGGGLLTAGLALAWRWRQGLWRTLLVVTVSGALAAQGVQWLWSMWPGMDENLRAGLLFVGWQVCVAAALGFAAPTTPRAS